jgi:hypothetical protein
MAIVSHRLKLVYFAVPKNACSSVKQMLFHADTGRPFDPLAETGDAAAEVHRLYPSVEDGGKIERWMGGYTRFAILRDPVARFWSGYRDRIVARQDMKHAAEQYERARGNLRRAKLPALPDPDTFAANIATYVASVHIVEHHFRPQADFVGNVWQQLSFATGLEGLPRIQALLSERAGFTVPMAHANATARATTDEPALAPASLRKLHDYYAADYDLLDRLGIAHAPRGRATA